MNIFWRELKVNRKALVWWSLGMIFLVLSSMSKFAAYQGSPQAVNELFASLPESFKTIFGIGTFDLTTAKGFYGVVFIYVAVMATIHAVLLGSGIISKEERDKTSEFLFTKPVSRSKVITGKLFAAFVNIVILNIVTTVSSIQIVTAYNKGSESVTGEIVLLSVGLFFLQLLFFTAGAAFASLTKHPKRAGSISTAIVLVTFILYILIDLNSSLENLKYLTPFKYFDAKNIIPEGKLDPFFVTISGLLIIAFIASSYLVYKKRDLSV